MSKLSTGRFTLLATLFLVSPAWGDEQSLENWYQVELIVFAQEDNHGEEAYPKNPELNYPSPLRLLGPAARLHEPLPAGAGYNEILASLMVPQKFLTRDNLKERESFVLLDREHHNLNPEAYTLKRSKNYRVLFHGAWEQPINNTRSAPWVHVSGGDKYDKHHELEGSVRVYRSRFLHLNLDLWQSQFIPATTVESDLLAPTTALSPVLPPVPERPHSPVLQQLEMMDPVPLNPLDEVVADTTTAEVDRFKVGTLDTLNRAEQVGEKRLTYIDHPRMGALVLLTPIEVEGEDGSEVATE